MSVKKYQYLFSEGRIGNVRLKNRVVLPPLEVGMANFDGTPSEQLINYYEERAKGGCGLIMTGITRVNDLHGAAVPRQLAVSNDHHIKPLSDLVNRIHSHGAKIFVQLHHPGRQNLSLMVLFWPMMLKTGRYWSGFWKSFPHLLPYAENFYKTIWSPAVVAPSNVPCSHVKQKTRALSKREIKRLAKEFIQGAKRVQLAGADGVELHAAHGYLIQQFLSTRTNKRKDEYGGSLENRMRFLMEIISGVRKVCGSDFPIAVRLAVDEYYSCIGEIDCGIELAEGVQIAKRLEQAGIDAVDVTGATYETMNYWLEPTTFEPGWRKNLAQAVKQEVGIPVLAANLIRSPEQANQHIKDGIQDLVCLGRPQVADPHWVNKTMQGREAEIKRCINCLYCFESLNINAAKGEPLECTINPKLGRERATQSPEKNGNNRTVAVIGAGPGGLSAAEVLAERGFNTIVFERHGEVGGQLQLANKPPKKEKINWCFNDLKHAAENNGAQIKFQHSATAQDINELNPYAVIVATGGTAIKPHIPGIEQEHVCTITEVLNGEIQLKDKKVAVIGSGMTGLETAEKLAEDGNSLTIVEMMEEIGPGAYHQNLDDILLRLERYTPRFITGKKLVAIKENSIMLEELKSGASIELDIEYVVMAVGVKSNNALSTELQSNFEKVYTIGDAHHIGRIANATRDGFDTAWNLE